jgi:hypothetical protein
MSHPAHRVAGRYRVTFSPEAWKLIGLMPSAIFQSLQVMLEHLADAPRRLAEVPSTEMSVTMDHLTVVYRLDDKERTLTVLDIQRMDSALE